MAYKNPLDERLRAARRKHYYDNKSQYLERTKQKKIELKLYILDIKNKTPCADCGIIYYDEPWLTEFDHLKDKRMSITKMITYGSLEKLKEEINKCELVCVVCHRRRTAKRGNWKLAGT